MSDTPSCTRCGAEISMSRWMGQKTCASCAKAIGWERRRRVLDGTATEIDKAVYAYRQTQIDRRMKYVGNCIDCGQAVRSATPIHETRRCKTCHYKRMRTARRALGAGKATHALRIRKEFLDALRATWENGPKSVRFNEFLAARLMTGLDVEGTANV